MTCSGLRPAAADALVQRRSSGEKNILDNQVGAWSQGAKRLLHVKARPPAVPERPSHVSRSDVIDRSWMI